MSKFSLLFLLLSSYCFSSQYNYTLNISLNSNDAHNKVFINDKLVLCTCGKTPICIMYLQGKFEYYCANHMPEIEYCRRITSKDVDDLLKSVHETNWNGSNE